MGFKIATLWQAPEINPVNRKARSIPILNPFNVYGRVFNFGWFGFMIAFWSWYAFPPLLTITIKADLGLSQTDIANSNIIGLVATLLVRVVAGPMCDLIGPRYTFAACLLAGSIPTARAGCVTNASGLMALRFFIGILGGSFVPCQVWSTGFFDKNVVGTANALAGGWGNSGGGITYFVMPAIFDSLVQSRGLSAHVAWRVAFIVPFILIVVTAITMLICCPDTPTGKWSERHLHVQENLQAHGVSGEGIVPVPGAITEKPAAGLEARHGSGSDDEKRLQEEAGISAAKHNFDHEGTMDTQEMIDTARGEVVVKPSFKEAMSVIFTLQTATVAFCYFCSFGTELAVNSILGAYYLKNFPTLGQTGTGNWAAMFGLLNIVFRPLGGVISDLIYRKTHSVWGKKILVHTLAFITGGFLIAIGILDSKNHSTMFGLIAGMAFFLEAGNGANFSLVPHVHPFANGIISGITGAAGNLGGIVFAIIFRYLGTDYGKTIWIIGVMTIGLNLLVCWIPPIPKGQIGGR
jgi:NNP family nitrate/nitrite transporter-like MFS transporter